MGPLDSPEATPDRARRSIPAAARDSVEPNHGPPFGLTFRDERGVLSLETWPLAAIARLDTLTVEIPGVVSPAEGGAAPAVDGARPPLERLRNRRGRFIAATITSDLDRVAEELARTGIRARLAAAGISDVRIGITGGSFRLVGRAAMGDREAAFTARARIERKGARRVRLSVDDLRIYGFLPVPAPLVARAIVTGLVPARPGPRWWIDLDPLEIALLETFTAHGWRLPDLSEARLETLQIAPEGILFGWTGVAPETQPPTQGALDGAAQGTLDGGGAVSRAPDPGNTSLDEADGLLARGDHQGALDAYRRALKERPDDPVATKRVLEILASNPGHLGEADDLAAEILVREAEEPLPLLVRAVAATERGELALAADSYEQIATIARRRNEEEDVIIARLAAAEQWLRADKTERARRLAEQVLATLPPHANGETARLLRSLSDRLIAKGELDAADQIFESRLALATDAVTRDALTTERARTRLLGPGGAPAALAVLAGIALDTAPQEVLVLRAEIAEGQVSVDDAVPAFEELAARARRAGDEEAARQIEDRVSALLARARTAPAEPTDDLEPTASASVDGVGAPGVPERDRDGVAALAAEDLERHLVNNPSDAAAAESLADIYGRIAEPRERADALAGLLRRALGLTPERRKAIYADLGESAEASGDLDRAEQAYWRAATIEAEPALRASFLVSHARVLLARGETETAINELEEALARAPDHAGALALLGDLAFRKHDWARARAIYASLAASPGAAEVISRELLLHRRAQLAQAVGEESEAENHLREVAILNPRHVEARESLANIALGRGDFGGAALRLEEVLRLLPLDALERLLEVRQRLGGVYLQLQDWSSARYYIELVLSQDPTRTAALEVLIDVYLRLSAYREAADACNRLARVDASPRRRAEILYHQGEILRVHLDDEAAAVDAYLRSSDLDPQFAPSLVRLADSYWRHGELDDLADLAPELIGVPSPTEAEQVDLPIRLAIATRLVPSTGDPPAPLPPLDQTGGELARRARALAEAAGFFGARPPRDLDPALEALLDAGAIGEGVAPGPANGLYRALAELVQEDPAAANMGAVRALGRAAECLGLTAAARGMYSLLVFVDPNDAAAAALQTLGPAVRGGPPRNAPDGVLGVLAEQQPLDALETIARDDWLASSGDADADADGNRDAGAGPRHRRELLRTPAARELIGTLLSSAYQRAFG